MTLAARLYVGVLVGCNSTSQEDALNHQIRPCELVKEKGHVALIGYSEILAEQRACYLT